MIRHLIVQYGALGLAAVVLAFTLVKGVLIYRKGLGKHFSELFVLSLIPISKQGIKNTFQDKIKKYYRQSNTINYFFYTLFIVCVIVYVMMYSVS